jgi:valyl-tRNA synthetase
VRENKMSQFLSTSTANEVDLIFENCIQKLEHSYEIYQTSKDLIGKSKQESEEQRNLILSQVEKDIEHFVDMISRIRALRLKTSLDDSEEIKRRLSIQLRAAERTQVEMERVKNPDDLTRFKEFRDS